MSEDLRDRNDPELKCLSVERSNFNDPATQAEWTQKRLVWVPSDTQVIHVHNFHPSNRDDCVNWTIRIEKIPMKMWKFLTPDVHFHCALIIMRILFFYRVFLNLFFFAIQAVFVFFTSILFTRTRVFAFINYCLATSLKSNLISVHTFY